jgi:hypothetical protein
MAEVEYSIMASPVNKWVTIDHDGRLVLSFASEPPSMRLLFPDSEEAGSEAFAWSFLEWMRDGGKSPIHGVTIAISEATIRNCGVYRMRKQQIEELPRVSYYPQESSDILFDVGAPMENLSIWRASYLNRFPTRRFQTMIVEYADEVLRVWRRRISFDTNYSAGITPTY